MRRYFYWAAAFASLFGAAALYFYLSSESASAPASSADSAPVGSAKNLTPLKSRSTITPFDPIHDVAMRYGVAAGFQDVCANLAESEMLSANIGNTVEAIQATAPNVSDLDRHVPRLVQQCRDVRALWSTHLRTPQNPVATTPYKDLSEPQRAYLDTVRALSDMGTWCLSGKSVNAAVVDSLDPVERAHLLRSLAKTSLHYSRVRHDGAEMPAALRERVAGYVKESCDVLGDCDAEHEFSIARCYAGGQCGLDLYTWLQQAYPTLGAASFKETVDITSLQRARDQASGSQVAGFAAELSSSCQDFTERADALDNAARAKVDPSLDTSWVKN
jgi:hypothetical protein